MNHRKEINKKALSMFAENSTILYVAAIRTGEHCKVVDGEKTKITRMFRYIICNVTTSLFFRDAEEFYQEVSKLSRRKRLKNQLPLDKIYLLLSQRKEFVFFGSSITRKTNFNLRQVVGEEYKDVLPSFYEGMIAIENDLKWVKFSYTSFIRTDYYGNHTEKYLFRRIGEKPMFYGVGTKIFRPFLEHLDLESLMVNSYNSSIISRKGHICFACVPVDPPDYPANMEILKDVLNPERAGLRTFEQLTEKNQIHLEQVRVAVGKLRE